MQSLLLAFRAIAVLALFLFVDEVIICIGNLLEENDNGSWNLNWDARNQKRPASQANFQKEQNGRLQVCGFCLPFILDIYQRTRNHK